MIDISALVLKHGSHRSPSEGLCLMEAVAMFAGEPHTDRPACACPVLTDYGIRLNDRLREDERQCLKPFIPRLVGTRSTPEVARRRSYLIVDRAIRIIVPMALEKRWPEHAAKLQGLDEIRDEASARAAQIACDAAADAADRAAASAARAADAAAYAAAYSADAASAADAAARAAASAAAYAAARAADAAAARAADAAAADAARRPFVAEAIATFELALEIV